MKYLLRNVNAGIVRITNKMKLILKHEYKNGRCCCISHCCDLHDETDESKCRDIER